VFFAFLHLLTDMWNWPPLEGGRSGDELRRLERGWEDFGIAVRGVLGAWKDRETLPHQTKRQGTFCGDSNTRGQGATISPHKGQKPSIGGKREHVSCANPFPPERKGGPVPSADRAPFSAVRMGEGKKKLSLRYSSPGGGKKGPRALPAP